MPEIDIVTRDASPVADRLRHAGAVKWLNDNPLTQADLTRLVAELAVVPGASPELQLVAVLRRGVAAKGGAALDPDDLIAAR